jgi:predicted transcriptional regulator
MNESESVAHPHTKALRAAEFKAKVKQTGLSPTEFAARAGLTRNVYYNLSIGQEPKPDQKRRIEAMFADPNRSVASRE